MKCIPLCTRCGKAISPDDHYTAPDGRDLCGACDRALFRRVDGEVPIFTDNAPYEGVNEDWHRRGWR